MDWTYAHSILLIIQRSISYCGVLIILSGIIVALSQYLYYVFSGELRSRAAKINIIRLNFSRILILGLEFIVAADLIGSTTTPDYYSLGILAIIVAIRTVLSFSINRDLMMLSRE